jgi:hypothetical protein
VIRAATRIGVLAWTMSSFAGAEELADAAKFQAFVATSDMHKGLIAHALAELPTTIFQRCPSLVSKGSRVTVLKPISFGPSGVPNAGVWKESFPVAGCGNDTTLNFFFSASAEEKIWTTIGLPGATIADPILQKDAMTEAAAAAAKAGPKDCQSLTVINTEVLRNVADPLEGSKGSPWDELWTLILCATKAQVTMHFVPDKTGTTIQTNPSETKILGR